MTQLNRCFSKPKFLNKNHKNTFESSIPWFIRYPLRSAIPRSRGEWIKTFFLSNQLIINGRRFVWREEIRTPRKSFRVDEPFKFFFRSKFKRAKTQSNLKTLLETFKRAKRYLILLTSSNPFRILSDWMITMKIINRAYVFVCISMYGILLLICKGVWVLKKKKKVKEIWEGKKNFQFKIEQWLATMNITRFGIRRKRS